MTTIGNSPAPRTLTPSITPTTQETAPKPKTAEAPKPAVAAEANGWKRFAGDDKKKADKPKADEKKRGGFGFGDLLGGLKGTVDGIKDKVQPKLTPEQRGHLEAAYDMLAPNKLGGADETFNHGDIQQISNALLNDRAGLKREIKKELPNQIAAKNKRTPRTNMGKRAQQRRNQRRTRVASNVLDRGFAGGQGPLAKMAMKKVNSEAPAQMRQQLEAQLAAEKIDPATAAQVDPMPRDLTFADLREFEGHAEGLKQLQDELQQRIGLEVTFPGGLSRAAIRHQLDGKFGIPPGAVFGPLKKD